MKGLLNELKQFVTNIGKGFTYIFVELPKKALKLDKIQPKKAERVNLNVVQIDKKSTFGKIKDAIIEKYENLPSVKKKKEAYEATLKPFVLNPDGSDAIKSESKQMFEYVARNEEGKIIKGYFAALSKLDVYSYLTDRKMIVYSIVTNSTINFIHGQSAAISTKMATKDLVFWLTQLATYIKAGIPLTDSVKVLSQQDKRRKYKPIYEDLIYQLTMGQTFSEALNRQGTAFPALLINMIKSAEMTGSIEETLEEMSQYYQEKEDNKKDIISALAYPMIVLLFAVVIVTFMLVYIVPKFVDVYATMKAEVPKITQITLDFSAFLQTKWMYLLSGIAAVIITYVVLYKKVKAFRTFQQSIFMRLPVIGTVMVSKEMNMFARTFASLQKNNVLLTDSIDVLAKITSNEIYKDLEMKTVQNLIRGNKMSESFKDHWAIPDIAYFMIVTGESTGELAEMLDRVADFYAKQQKNAIGQIKTFIEPVMILFLAVIVGFILIAILVPMFGIYSTVA